MSDKPILMSGPMVRALLSGTKTQTRRLVKPMKAQSEWLTVECLNTSPKATMAIAVGHGLGAQLEHPRGGPLTWICCPYGQPGDRLWVRETWYCNHTDAISSPFIKPLDVPLDECMYYLADGEPEWEDGEGPTRWRPSIHMPRWASRITLEITDVRVQRLQEISARDALAEGVFGDGDYATHPPLPYPVATYRKLWESINGAGSWGANPWVWALTFRKVTT